MHYFISDLHLEEQRPDITESLLTFLKQEAPQAEALYILGDFFEAWIGDDALPRWAKPIVDALKQLSDQGVSIYLMHGNRDFLMGETLATQCGAELIPELQIIDLYGTPTLLLHGDSLCTDDHEYQAFRAMVRHDEWQHMFLSKPVEERIAIARQLREASKAHQADALATNKTQAEAIMDVNDKAVIQCLQEHKVHTMIHGHTHRPAYHRIALDNGSAYRVVLGDWYEQSSVLRVDESGFYLSNLGKPLERL